MAMKVITGCVILALFGVLVAACFIKRTVQVGKIVSCRTCSKVIEDTTYGSRVPWWDSTDYHVMRKMDYCAECGNAPVSYVVESQCRHCARIYERESRTAARREERQKVLTSDGYCAACLEPVSYSVSYVCRECTAAYRKETLTAARYLNPGSQIKKEGFCAPCSTPARWTAQLACEKCGKNYDTYVTTAARKDHPKSHVTVGLCKWCKFRAGVKALGERTGEVTGDLVDGMIKGGKNR